MPFLFFLYAKGEKDTMISEITVKLYVIFFTKGEKRHNDIRKHYKVTCQK